MPKKYLIFLWILGLLIYYPLLFPGYVFSLDQAFSYYYEWPKFWANNFWMHIVGMILQTLNIPLMLFEKLIYTGMIWCIWYFGYKIFVKSGSHLATTFGIIFLFVNPFFYARFIEWQVNIYVSYAFLIAFLYYFIEYFYYKNFKYWKHMSFVIFMLGLTSLHNVFLLALPLGIWYISLILSAKNKKNILKKLWFLTLVLFFTNSLWAIPTMMRGSLTSQIESFWENHRSAFESWAWDYNNIYWNHLALKWYWWEAEWRFARAELGLTGNWIFLCFILLLVWAWVSSWIRNSSYRSITVSLLFVATISYILSFWTSWGNIFSGLNVFLFNHIPYYLGFREPHKWIFFVTFFYAYFAVLWISFLQNYISQKNVQWLWVKILFCFILLLPVLYTPAVLIWYWGQLKSTQYPLWWQELRANLTQTSIQDCQSFKTWASEKCYTTLVLPWHWYINISWTGRPIVIAWIMKYFWPWALFGDTIEIRDIYTQSSRPESKIIEKYVPMIWQESTELNEQKSEEFLTDLQDLGIQHIVLLKESDFASYEPLFQSLEKYQKADIIFENDFWIVYELILK